MTNPFMRVDISQSSRDFQPVALEPGLPLLDRSNSNNQTVRRWLGRFVAEPERTGDRVAFYVLDDESRRIDSAFCIPVSDKDLAGDLLKDFKELQKRCDAIKSQSPKEQLIHRAIADQLRNITDNNERDRRTCLFKFRDGKNKLHLVWAPGYRRRDVEPAVPLVCTNPACLQLFLRRGDSGAKCYVCNTLRRDSMLVREPRSYVGMSVRLVVCACFIALGVVGTIWWQQRQPLNSDNPNRTAEAKGIVTATPDLQSLAAPLSLRWGPKHDTSVTVPVGAEFFDWSVESVSNDGAVTDVSKLVTLVVDSDPGMPITSDTQSTSSTEQVPSVAGNPKHSAAAIRRGRIFGVSPGESTVHAVYRNNRTATGLNVVVTSDLNVDEIRIDPFNADLIAGESSCLKAIGYKSGKTVGEITNRGDLLWQSGNEQLVHVDGPQVYAKSTGTTSVIASIGTLKSKPCAVVVHAANENEKSPLLGELVVIPAKLQMKAGEIAKLGHEFQVQRNGLDVTDACEVVASSARTLNFDDASGTLQALSPGRSQITFIVRDQSATLNIEVEPHVVPATHSRVVIEPANGLLAVGEKCPLRVFVVTPDGLRMPLPALRAARAVNVAIVDGMEIQGVTPGEVIVEAVVPGIDQIGRATFKIEQIDFDRLTFNPASLSVAIGQRKLFEILGVTRRGRLRLGDDPNLKFVGIGASQNEGTDLSGPECYEVVGLSPGNGAIVAKWKGGLEQRMPVTIRSDRILELMIHPDQSRLTEGMILDYQIMARREGRLQPLDHADGVELVVDDLGIATANDTQVTAIKSGTTRVTAKYGTLSVAAQLTVMPRSQPAPSPAVPVRLRFLTDVLQIELGDSSSPIRAVRVFSDGSEEAVDERLTFTIKEPSNVVGVEVTDAGSVIRAKTVGTTEIEASLGNLRTERPSLVEVLPKMLRQPELRACPGSLRLLVGETKKFVRADILPGTTGRPISVPFTVTAMPNKTIEVRPDGSIYGLAAGIAIVIMSANDQDGRFAGTENFAVVEVVNP